MSSLTLFCPPPCPGKEIDRQSQHRIFMVHSSFVPVISAHNEINPTTADMQANKQHLKCSRQLADYLILLSMDLFQQNRYRCIRCQSCYGGTYVRILIITMIIEICEIVIGSSPGHQLLKLRERNLAKPPKKQASQLTGR